MTVARRKNKFKYPENTECPLTASMQLLGGAWTPQIIWFLAAEPRRFSELIDDIGGVSPKVLTERLRKMESTGVVVRTVRPTSPPTVEYSLSEAGKELRPAIEAIIRVGKRLKERAKVQAQAEASSTRSRRLTSLHTQ